MNILVVSDLHYSLPQFDWLYPRCEKADLLVVAGDVMELGSYVDPDTQAAVVGQYFRKLAGVVPVLVCSGNHDLVDEGNGERSPDWLQDLEIPNVFVDGDVFENDEVKILIFPWWESEEQHDKIHSWVAKESQVQGKPVYWVHHAPPVASKVSWNGKRDLGDKSVREWIENHQPDLVFTGHIHNAPYYPDGGWIDRIGNTTITNGGKQTGNMPATIEVDTEAKELTWCGMEGCHTHKFG